MELEFYKYQGTGNDFILIDNRQNIFPKNDTKLVAKMCDRRFGIGADGLILLELRDTVDFNMVYYNSDGNLSSMCGNGGRCIMHFANFLEIVGTSAVFEAVDGMHSATIKGNNVSLKMSDVERVSKEKGHVFLDTGSPHHVEIVTNLGDYDVKTNGAAIRYNIYGAAGANVNFVEAEGRNSFSVRTYERGVEDETLSCGTGVTAVALAMFELNETDANLVVLNTPGGSLQVSFERKDQGYENIYLEGPAEQVFKGIFS